MVDSLSPGDAPDNDAAELSKRMELLEASLAEGPTADNLLVSRLADVFEKAGVDEMIKGWYKLVDDCPDRWQLQT